MPIPPGDKIPQNLITWSQEVEKKIEEAKNTLPVGITVTIDLAPLTGGGQAGKLIFTKGVLTSCIQPN